MIKRMICTLAALAMLIWTCPPARAEFKGQLLRDIEWILNFDNSASAGPTAVTVHYLIGKSGEKEISRDEIEIASVDANARTQLFFSTPGRGVRRIIIEVDQPTGATIDVEVTQSAPFQNSSFPHRFEGPGSLVFDVVD
jgi:hypothetical protein